MVVVDDSKRTHSPSQTAWSEGQRLLGAVLHSSNEPSELSLSCGYYKHRPGYSYFVIIIIIITSSDQILPDNQTRLGESV